ncbi:MAG: hypothetical protein GY835_12405 [bacterium]|nr:hypothetical protein [bacterium]
MKQATQVVTGNDSMPAKSFFNIMLGQVERFMECPISYFATVEKDETMLIMRGWSRNVMAVCASTDKPLVYKLEETGVWGDASGRERP